MTSGFPEELLVDGLSADRVAEIFYRKGVVAFHRTMPEDWIARASSFTMKRLEAHIASLESRHKRDIGIGKEAGSNEIVQRSSGRFDLNFASELPASAELPSMDAEAILAAVGAILGHDWRIELRGALVALPGAREMAWHVDGSHLFPGLPIHLPAHALNIFIPLVDITEEMGPTEFCPGSHFLTRNTRPSYVQSSVSLESLGYTDIPVRGTLSTGAALLADFRTLHRALSNRSKHPRPILYFSCAKPWFRDGAFPEQPRNGAEGRVRARR